MPCSIVESKQYSKSSAANVHRIPQHCLEYRFKLARRTADDLEHVGGRRLLLQRFAQLAEETRVFDGDDGLRGEIFDQLNLSVSERPHFLAVNGNRTDQLALLQHRDNE
ncbi:MAG: hypothetical protein WA759_06540 [Pseudolabrys sp.]